MSFTLTNGIVNEVSFLKANAIYGQITPRILVVHDTAGRLDKLSSANYLQSHKSVSVHFVIERDGTISQLVPVNHRAGHAGKSHYHGEDNVNSFSIGIELVNPGGLSKVDDHTVASWFDEEYDIVECGIRNVSSPNHHSKYWMPYPEAQLNALFVLADFLVDELGLTDIVPHWYISPGRKEDTSPIFPLEKLKAHCFGRDPQISADAIADDQSDVTAKAWGKVKAPNDSVNMREWPSFNPNVLKQIPHGTLVPILKAGKFPKDAPEEEQRLWMQVAYGGLQGWVIARYINEQSEK